MEPDNINTDYLAVLVTNNDIQQIQNLFKEKIVALQHVRDLATILDLLGCSDEVEQMVINYLEQHAEDNIKLDNHQKQVAMAVEDLSQYPKESIVSLAKMLGIDTNGTGRYHVDKALLEEIAMKLLYINNQGCSSVLKRFDAGLTRQEISQKRQQIYDAFNQFSNTVIDMTPDDLYKLVLMYDKVFFQGQIKQSAKNLKLKSNGDEGFMTESFCFKNTCNYIITIPVEKFAGINGITMVAGHECKDQLECLLRVIEHEIVHLLIFMNCQNYFMTSQHNKLFMDTAKKLFAHTDHRHYIFSQQ